MSEKPRFPRLVALRVAKELCDELRPFTTRLIVAGSLRRKKDTVGDVEILYISPVETLPSEGDMFATTQVAKADIILYDLIGRGILAKRPDSQGRFIWGDKNKLAIHLATGMPVDLFAATQENWWNYLVCRTGPADSNARIATLAQRRGWKWNPYGQGFTNLETNEVAHMGSEEAVFQFVGLPYHEPKDRA